MTYFPRWFWPFLYLIERLSDYRYLALRGDGWSRLEKNSERSRQHIKKMKMSEGMFAESGDSATDELSKTFPCPKCKRECGVDDIYGCETLRCPKCGEVFEPEEEGMQQ
jgi:hypothetical protein